MPPDHATSPKPRASQIQHDRAEIRGCRIRIANAIDAGVEPNECILNNVFPRFAVVNEDTGKPH